MGHSCQPVGQAEVKMGGVEQDLLEQVRVTQPSDDLALALLVG
jgi:hypothetical protein